MSRQRAGWLGAAVLGLVCLDSCGAMTIETAPPDEPIAAPARVPRLVRRDAAFEAIEAGQRQDDDRH